MQHQQLRQRVYGTPVTCTMRSSWFMVEVPGNIGLPPSSSPSMHPAGADRASNADEYGQKHSAHVTLSARPPHAKRPIAACHVSFSGPLRVSQEQSSRQRRTAGPEVHAVGVLGGAEQDLRRPVPPCGHIVREEGRGPAVSPHRLQGARQAEVRQLHAALAVEQQVAGLRAQAAESAGALD